MPLTAPALTAHLHREDVTTNRWCGGVVLAFVSMRTGSRLCSRLTLSPGEYMMAHQHSVHTMPMLLSCVVATRCSASHAAAWPGV